MQDALVRSDSEARNETSHETLDNSETDRGKAFDRIIHFRLIAHIAL